MATVFTKSTTPDLGKSVSHRVEELVLALGVVGFAYDAALAVTVPAITDPDDAHVDVTVTGVAVGDAVLVANPAEALPTNCLFTGAYVSATNTVRFNFASEGGNVSSSAKNFVLIVADRT